MTKVKQHKTNKNIAGGYNVLLHSVSDLLEQARKQSARVVNTILTATYWEVGRRIVEFEQKGEERAEYGEQLLQHLASDLIQQFGRGFSRQNLQLMRLFYNSYPIDQICQTVSGKLQTPSSDFTEAGIYATVSRKSDSFEINRTLSVKSNIFQTVSAISSDPISPTPSGKLQTLAEKYKTLPQKFTLPQLAQALPLPWSHYVRLLSVDNPDARAFYETEAIRGGWSVRQLDRQISTQFYERTALSKNKTAMLAKGAKPHPDEIMTAEQEIKDPYVLEFLGLKDEYSESDLEEALVQHLERFLLELGGDFAFIGRQKRLRIGTEWYRIDLLFFHRKLRCLIVIDLKVGKFTHADAGQMHLYLNYAREHWTHKNENPPVGLILCAEKDSTVAKYALEGLPNKVLAAEYKLALPNEKQFVRELEETWKKLIPHKSK